jgi:hypothetical protein
MAESRHPGLSKRDYFFFDFFAAFFLAGTCSHLQSMNCAFMEYSCRENARQWEEIFCTKNIFVVHNFGFLFR